jgi:hypothetical protein
VDKPIKEDELPVKFYDYSDRYYNEKQAVMVLVYINTQLSRSVVSINKPYFVAPVVGNIGLLVSV